MNDHTVSRRQIFAGVAASTLAGAAYATPAPERYRLGVMTSIYPSVPLDDAIARIRKAGYQYIAPGNRHAGQNVFTPALPKAERASLRRHMRDLGVQPIMSLGGFYAPGELQTDESLDAYKAELDLCADFEIPVMVGGGPWSYTKFPNLPKSQREFRPLVDRFFANMEKAVQHAEAVKVIIALKPHTGITARARDCMQVAGRIASPNFKISWDAGNVSFYEGIYPDPDLPDLAPNVCSVCLKDHKGLRGVADFPVPGQGNIDHELMFKTLYAAGFKGPISIERVDGHDGRITPDVADQRLTAANQYLVPLLDRITA